MISGLGEAAARRYRHSHCTVHVRERLRLRDGERIFFRTGDSSSRCYAEPFNEGFDCFTAEADGVPCRVLVRPLSG
jgi:hypothetical protein